MSAEMLVSAADIFYNDRMTKLICRLVGHRELSDEVLALRPWEDPDFAGYAFADFREPSCLRCGVELAPLAVEERHDGVAAA